MKSELKDKIIKEIKSTIECIALAFGLYFLITVFVFEFADVSGDSMYPTLTDRQRVIAYKVDYIVNNPKRFDIVIIKNDIVNDNFIIKRVIGLPGEEVLIDKDGIIYINGNKLDEDYGNDIIKEPGIAEDGIILGDEEYFVIGDNRNNSIDSRSHMIGLINRKDIYAKAIELEFFKEVIQ